MFKLKICTNPYTHNKTHKTNKSRNNSYIQTPERNISSTKRTISKIVGGTFYGRFDLESHADTTVVGENCTIIKYTDRSCDVALFSGKYTPMKGILVVSAATGITLANGRNYILVFYEALYMPGMRHTLINPNQCRHFGAKVQENPYHKDCPMSIEIPDRECAACLQSIGTVMFLDTWFPMQGDLDSYPHIELTSRQHWNPHKIEFPQKSIQCKSS